MVAESKDRSIQVDGVLAEQGDSIIASVLRLPELHAVAEGLVEAGLDSFVDNPAVDAIPIVATLKALVRGGTGYREAWLSKKLISMLYGVGPVSDEDIGRWRRRLSSEQRTAETGERILALVDRVTTTWKAQVLGELFRAYLDRHCDRRDFLRAAEMVGESLREREMTIRAFRILGS